MSKEEEIAISAMGALISDKLAKYSPFKTKGLTDEKRSKLRKKRKKKNKSK